MGNTRYACSHLLEPGIDLKLFDLCQRHWGIRLAVFGTGRTISGGRADLRHLIAGCVEDAWGGKITKVTLESGLPSKGALCFVCAALCTIRERNWRAGKRGLDMMRREVERA